MTAGRKRLLALEDDWDGEGSPRYAPETLDRVERFLVTYLHYCSHRYGVVVPVPQLRPGPEGSVDIHWEERSYELLLEFPADGPLASYSGENVRGEEIEGLIDVTAFPVASGLVLWLSQGE
jgi:hypothetical protein